jgi:hypothetical protein
MKFLQLSSTAAIGLVAMMGTSSAASFTGSGTATGCPGCTITVYGTTALQTEPSNLPFPTLNLGTSSSAPNSFISSSAISGGALTAAGISSIMFPTAGDSGTPVTGFVSGEYAGTIGNVASSPFGSTDSTTNYLVAQANGGSVVINYSAAQDSFALLWGTVDNGSQQNLLGLTLTAGGVQITGQDIENIITGGPPGAGQAFTNGQLDVGVVVTMLGGTFTTVTATDNAANSAFEFVPLVVPAPLIGHGFLALLAVGGMLFGAKLWDRSKRRSALETAIQNAA